MTQYKFFIPCAGIGSRLKDLTKVKNKALIEVNGKAVIEYILDNVPEKVPVVIGLGFRGDEVRSFLEEKYPKRTFEFKIVDNYDGPGSGLGYSMLCCKDALQCPFVFCSNDTIVTEKIPEPDHNWIGHAKEGNCEMFRSMRKENDVVAELCEKGLDKALPYIGLAGVYSWEFFWKNVDQNDEQFMKIGESASIRRMVESDMEVKAYEFTWYDTGNLYELENTKKSLRQ